MIAPEYGVSFGSDENVLKFSCGDSSTMLKTNDLSTLNK